MNFPSACLCLVRSHLISPPCFVFYVLLELLSSWSTALRLPLLFISGSLLLPLLFQSLASLYFKRVLGWRRPSLKITPTVWSFHVEFELEAGRVYVNRIEYMWVLWNVVGSVFPSAAGLKSCGWKSPVSLIGFSVSAPLSHPCTSKEVHQKGQLGQQKSFIRHMAAWKRVSG